MKNRRFASTITNDELSEMPPAAFGGRIIVVEDEQALAAACEYLRVQSIIGFDTETRPSFKAGVVHRVALLQLSTQERCYLIRLSKLRLDKAVTKILENPEILKVGADVVLDLRALQKLRRFRHDGFIDLQSMMSEWGIAEKSVRKMAAIVLGLRVSKAQRLSNWEAAELTPPQQMYAATDAWICIEIYDRLMANRICEK
ncbi:MAG: 3'-5' exonuclease domain-containing protein 2 [Rikenellaceae bacterium]|nr:3'-5' exonuclease domain-containing protein 2 [Rikenellaceae bacterium]MCL2691961.1 3'-5' exonuclease domain-containing protein 2 [Rikenellaceae bacterium]